MNKQQEEQIKELKKAHAKVLRSVKAFEKATTAYWGEAVGILGTSDLQLMWAGNVGNDFILQALVCPKPGILEECDMLRDISYPLELEDLIDKIKEQEDQ
jgi:hypothetical protein